MVVCEHSLLGAMTKTSSALDAKVQVHYRDNSDQHLYGLLLQPYTQVQALHDLHLILDYSWLCSEI